MKKLITWIIVLAVVAGAVWLPGKHSLVRAPKRLILLKKTEFSLKEVYVDIREWNLAEYANHPALTKALVIQGYKDLMDQAAPK